MWDKTASTHEYKKIVFKSSLFCSVMDKVIKDHKIIHKHTHSFPVPVILLSNPNSKY